MGIMELVKKMSQIDKECKHDEQLRKRLEPWVIKMNSKKPSSKKEAEKVANDFIAEYNRIKSDIRGEYEKTNSVSKIEQINER